MKEKARGFAIERHGKQQYGEEPYIAHLDTVAKIVSEYGGDAVVTAYLHDVVEDTETTIEEIEFIFGSFISRCVAILTDEPGDNRKERKAKTYQKMSVIVGEEQLALVVKTADRLANLRACKAHKNNNLLSMYRKEHTFFRQAVYREGLCESLWEEVEAIING